MQSDLTLSDEIPSRRGPRPAAGYFSKRHRGRRMTLHVTTRTWAAAERLARDYAGQDLERVLAAFVGDLAAAAERPGCWERDRLGAWLAGHPWPRPEKEGA